MKTTLVRNTGLKAGMFVLVDGTAKMIQRILFGTFDTAIVEFSDGKRAAFSLRTTSTVFLVD